MYLICNAQNYAKFIKYAILRREKSSFLHISNDFADMGTLFIKPLFRYQPRKGLFGVEIVDFDGVMG